MPTNREIYFSLIKESNPYLTRLVIKAILNEVNGFFDDTTLYKNFDVDCQNLDKLTSYINRIKGGEPYQYVLGYANFIDWNFYVNDDVLIPRQETEELVISTRLMIESIFGKESSIEIADVGTGSGCIAISMKRFFKSASIDAFDISEDALKVAKKNAKSLGQDISFFQGDWIEPILRSGKKYDVLISNPPYIKDHTTVDKQVLEHEPHLALFAEPTTKYYELIFKNAHKIMKERSIMAFEIGEDMERALIECIGDYFTYTNITFRVSKDMYKKTRFLYIMIDGDSNYEEA